MKNFSIFVSECPWRFQKNVESHEFFLKVLVAAVSRTVSLQHMYTHSGTHTSAWFWEYVHKVNLSGDIIFFRKHTLNILHESWIDLFVLKCRGDTAWSNNYNRNKTVMCKIDIWWLNSRFLPIPSGVSGTLFARARSIILYSFTESFRLNRRVRCCAQSEMNLYLHAKLVNSE